MKKFGYILLTAALSVFAACSEDVLDKVNEDVNHAPDADAKFIFADLGLSTAFSVVGGDFNTYLGVAVEHWGGVHNQLYKADQRNGEWISSSCFNNSWVGIYNTIKNCRTVIEKTADDAEGVDAGNSSLNAAAKILLAYNSAVLTDLFGDTPYSQAGDYEKYKTPAIDTQESIYQEIHTLLDDAIETLEANGGASLGIGSFDFIYGGNGAKWLQFGYALRARVTLHTLLRASDKSAAYSQILSDVDKAFTSAASQAQFTAYDGDNNINPLAMFWYSREAIAASQSMADKLIERDDPRANMIYCTPWDAGYLTPDECDFVPNGQGIEAQEYYSDDCYLYAFNAPTILLSYAETQFIKAEVLARQGNDAEAKEAALEAITAAFEIVNTNVDSAINAWGFTYEGELLTEDDAQAYFDAVVAPLSGEELLAEIMVQKYISFHGANGGSVEAYNDIRRLMAADEDFIELANPNNAAGKFPLRCGYGSSDTTTNPNVQSAFGDGSYVYKEPVWWAMGSK